MTLGAGDAARVVRMAKSGKGRPRRDGPGIGRNSMAGVARADLAFRRMAGIAARMSADPGRNRSPRAGRSVTRRAALGRAGSAGRMRRVIEPHIEPLVKPGRKGVHPDGSAFNVAMTNGAHKRAVTGKFAGMTRYTRVMAGKFQLR